MENSGVTRADILEFAAEHYGTESEQLWAAFPEYAVLRHPNGKWYGIVMRIKKNKLGMDSDGFADILVTKCDPAMQPSLLEQKGFLPAYHMNKEHWITIVLDGSAEKELAFYVLTGSYEATCGKFIKKSKGQS